MSFRDDPPEAARGRALSFVGAAGWTVLVAFVFQLSLGFVDSAHPGALGDLVSVTMCTLLAHAIVLFAILRVHEPETSIRHVLALRRPPVIAVLLGAIVGAALAPGASWLNRLFERRFPPTAQETELFAQLFSAATTGKRVFLAVALVVVMPACNELFFRGALFTLLKRGRRADLVVPAIAAYDALMGASPRGLASALLFALTLGWIRTVSGSAIPSLVAAMAFFTVDVIPLSLGREEPHVSASLAGGALGLAAVAMAALVFASNRSARAEGARIEDG